MREGVLGEWAKSVFAAEVQTYGPTLGRFEPDRAGVAFKTNLVFGLIRIGYQTEPIHPAQLLTKTRVIDRITAADSVHDRARHSGRDTGLDQTHSDLWIRSFQRLKIRPESFQVHCSAS